MSEAQQDKPADAWGQPINAERQAELQGYLDRWAAETDHGERKGPFEGIALTGADIFWLTGGYLGFKERFLREAQVLQSVSGFIDFDLLHLGGADFRQAHLEGARLPTARLEGARLFGASLLSADVWGSPWRTHLAGANGGCNLMATS